MLGWVGGKIIIRWKRASTAMIDIGIQDGPKHFLLFPCPVRFLTYWVISSLIFPPNPDIWIRLYPCIFYCPSYTHHHLSVRYEVFYVTLEWPPRYLPDLQGFNIQMKYIQYLLMYDLLFECVSLNYSISYYDHLFYIRVNNSLSFNPSLLHPQSIPDNSFWFIFKLLTENRYPRVLRCPLNFPLTQALRGRWMGVSQMTTHLYPMVPSKLD